MNYRSSFIKEQIHINYFVKLTFTHKFNSDIVLNDIPTGILDLHQKEKGNSNPLGYCKSKLTAKSSRFDNFKFYKNRLQKVTDLFFERQFLIEIGRQTSDLLASLLNSSKNALFSSKSYKFALKRYLQWS